MKFMRPMLLLILFPMVLFFTFEPMRAWRGPYYLGANSDPEYAYLLNSLNIIHGTPPGHRDHPGTTLQRLGGLSLKLFHSGASKQEITWAVLQNPEESLLFLAKILLAVSCFILFLAGLFFWQSTGSIASGIIFQALPFASTESWDTVGRFTPDLLVLVLALLFSSMAIWLFKNANIFPSVKKMILGGVVLGAAMATKITVLPIFLIPALVLRKSPTALLIFGLSALASFIFWISPILAKGSDGAQYFGKWVARLALRNGKYGSGETGLPSLQDFLAAGEMLMGAMPIFPVTIVIGLLICWLHSKNKILLSEEHKRWLGILLIVITSQLLMSIRQPNPRYLLPGLAACALFYALLHLQISSKKIQLSLVLIIFCAALFPGYTKFTRHEFIEKRDFELVRLENAALAEKCEVIHFYRSTGKAFALMFGNNFASSKYSEELRTLYPNYLVFDFSNVLDISLASVSEETLRTSGKKYCLRGWKDVFEQTPRTSWIKGNLILATETDDALYSIVFD